MTMQTYAPIANAAFVPLPRTALSEALRENVCTYKNFLLYQPKNMDRGPVGVNSTIVS